DGFDAGHHNIRVAFEGDRVVGCRPQGACQDAERDERSSNAAERKETVHGTAPVVCGTMKTATFWARRPSARASPGPVRRLLSRYASPAGFVASTSTPEGPRPAVDLG